LKMSWQDVCFVEELEDEIVWQSGFGKNAFLDG
jgi:hypothetical protein